MASWPKVVISQVEMAEVVNLSTDSNLLTKTSKLDIQRPSFSPWPTLAQTLTDPNSSSHLLRLPGLMENMSSLVKFLKVKISWESLKILEAKVEDQRKELRLPIVEKLKNENEINDWFYKIKTAKRKLRFLKSKQFCINLISLWYKMYLNVYH